MASYNKEDPNLGSEPHSVDDSVMDVQDSMRSTRRRDSTAIGDNDLFFQIGKASEEDELEELGELQRGVDFQATYIVSESAGKFREIVMTISLNGVKVGENGNKKRTREFQIDQIVQYSYNRSQQRFNFAYLEADGVLTNYRFMSKEFFDIHQTLGSAINLMVKVKNNEFTQEQLERAANGPPRKKFEAESPTNSVFTLATQAGQSVADQRATSEGHGLSRQLSVESLGGQSVMSKASITKFYMENKYKKYEEMSDSTKPATINDSPPIVVHGGDDDQELEAVDNSDITDPEVAQSESNRNSASIDDTFDTLSIETKGKDSKKKDKSSKTGTLRGWSLFGTQRGTPKTNVNRKGASGNELGSIDENNLGEGKLAIPEGTLGKGRFGGSPNDKRRKSVQEIFKVSEVAEESGVIRERTKSGASNISFSTGVLSEAAASATSIDSQSVKQDRELPPVDKKFDAYGREILIKNAKNGKYEITAGTIEALVECLAEEAPPDTIYIEVFLLTFRHFMTPAQFMKQLHARFLVQHENPQTAAIIRLRVVSVLKKWAERHYYDFRFPEMQVALEELITDVNKTECAKYGAQIKGILDSEMERSKSFAPPQKPVPPLEIQRVFDTADFITYWTPKKIAQELTLGDIRLFRQIKPDEFCIFLWGDKNDTRISNFNLYISRFNRLGFWVSTIVCSQKDIKRRVDAIEKVIQILKYCYKYQNYSTLMALLSGLNTTAVSRLKKTWEIVNKGRYISAYKDIEAKMSYRGNFKTYREIEAMAKAPFIPFFGLYVKDLTFMNDGNQKHVLLQTKQENPNPDAPPLSPIVNFEKCRTISEKIHAIRVFQQSTYRFEEEKDDTKDGFFSNFTTTHGTDAELVAYFNPPYGPPGIDDEKKLLEMSRECEPSERQGVGSSFTVSTAKSSSKDTTPRIAQQESISQNNGSSQEKKLPSIPAQ